MTTLDTIPAEMIWSVLETVTDPEIPVLTVIDLGIIREVKIIGTAQNSPSGSLGVGAEIIITPTYSGCPAMDMISTNIRLALAEAGYQNIRITSVLSPPWTTDWMTEAGKEKLKAYGIAPPNSKQVVCETKLFAKQESIQCPRCNSYQTRLISQYGSTACKALHQCEECKEPFDYFKCH